MATLNEVQSAANMVYGISGQGTGLQTIGSGWTQITGISSASDSSTGYQGAAWINTQTMDTI